MISGVPVATPVPTPALSLRGVSKAFQGVLALDDVDLDLRQGEVHALLGQNGSGKSTLIKILAGFHQPEEGATGQRSGVPFDLGSAPAAHAAGLRFIHQDVAVLKDLDVTDNLALGESYVGRRWISSRRENAAARAVFREYGVDIDPSATLGSLGPAQRTMTAIVRALHHGAEGGILVVDEATASLSEEECELLFGLTTRARDRGATIVWVTHRLREVFALADRVTVLRDGRKVATEPVSALTEDSLVELIVGRPLETLNAELPEPREDVVLDVRGLTGQTVKDVSFQVRAGEIVGIAGITGSGATELPHLVYGSTPREAGQVRLGADDLPPGHDPSDSIRAGIAFAPADRKHLSAIQSWTLRENVTLPKLRTRGWLRWLSARTERADAVSWLDRLGVTPARPELPLSALSGGNQQKIVLAKWFRCASRVLLLEEPTAGVDIGAKSAIYGILADAAKRGTATVLVSSDIDEVVSACDRVIVIREGRIAATLSGPACTVDSVTAEAIRVDDSRRSERESA